MYIFLQVGQLVIALLAVALTLIQTKGGGLSSGISSSVSFYRSRRGIEKFVFIFTVISLIAFTVNSLALTYFGVAQ